MKASAGIVPDYDDKLGRYQGFLEVKEDVGAIYEKLHTHFQLHWWEYQKKVVKFHNLLTEAEGAAFSCGGVFSFMCACKSSGKLVL